MKAYNPGFGAQAVAEAVFGGSNRWGRSIYTHYPAAYIKQVALNDFSVPPSAKSPGRTYRYYNNAAGPAPIVFGQGLSFNTQALSCSGGSDGLGSILINCTLTSLSGPRGDQILQVFHRVGPSVVARVSGAHPIPLSTLRDMQRFSVEEGATVQVQFSLDEGYTLSLVNATGARNPLAGLHYLDVWDGGANNVTVPITLGLDSVVSVPPLPPK